MARKGNRSKKENITHEPIKTLLQKAREDSVVDCVSLVVLGNIRLPAQSSLVEELGSEKTPNTRPRLMGRGFLLNILVVLTNGVGAWGMVEFHPISSAPFIFLSFLQNTSLVRLRRISFVFSAVATASSACSTLPSPSSSAGNGWNRDAAREL